MIVKIKMINKWYLANAILLLCPLRHNIENPVTKEEMDPDVSGMTAELNLESL